MCGYCVQSWFIGVRFFKAEICFGSHSLRGYQWSLKDSGVRVGTRIARGIYFFLVDLKIKGIALDLGPKAFDLGSQFWLALLYIFVMSIELGT